MLSYESDQKKLEDLKEGTQNNHIKHFEKHMSESKIILRGDTDEDKGLFFIFNSKDEKEPHQFMK